MSACQKENFSHWESRVKPIPNAGLSGDDTVIPEDIQKWMHRDKCTEINVRMYRNIDARKWMYRCTEMDAQKLCSRIKKKRYR